MNSLQCREPLAVDLTNIQAPGNGRENYIMYIQPYIYWEKRPENSGFVITIDQIKTQ